MASLTLIASIVGPFGTLSLAIAAFINIVKRRPKIELQEGISGQYLSITEDWSPGRPQKYYIYRLKVENSSGIFHAYAKNVHLRFVSIEKLDNSRRWKPLEPFNPFNMRWTSDITLQSTFYNDMAKGEELWVNFFTVVFTYEETNSGDKLTEAEILPGHAGLKELALASGFNEDCLKREGKFRFTIGVYGENVKARTFAYEVDLHGLSQPDWPVSIRRIGNAKKTPRP